MTTHKLTLTLYGAEGLHETGKIKKQDPYTIVEVGERVFKTKADSSAGSDPVWNEELQCEVPTGVTTASFTIHDKNLFVKDDIIGVAKYDFANATGEEETIAVYTKDGAPAGQLRLRAVFSGGRGAQSTGRATTGATTGAGYGAGAATGAAAGIAGAGARGAQTPVGAGTGVGAGTYGTSTYDDSSKSRGTSFGAPALHATAGPGTGITAGLGGHRSSGTDPIAYGVDRDGHPKGAPGFTGPMSNLAGDQGIVCEQKFYVVEEDRPIVKEVIQYVREHHPVQREMIVETKPTGRERVLPTGPAELVGVEEKVIEKSVPKACP